MDLEHSKGDTSGAKGAPQGSVMNRATTKVDKHAPNLDHGHDESKKLQPEVNFDKAKGEGHHKLATDIRDLAKKSADYGQD
jgi:hypothetical protein